MELDYKPYFRSASTNSSTELLICFASRLPSSPSMRFSKSILSPRRNRRGGGGGGEGLVSLSTSLSRRLRSSGNLKGGSSQASPFLANRKKGSGFENPEPSSPKVTCIGQVRVKTKKKVQQIKKDKDRIGSGHFQHHRWRDRSQRWVHFPVTICESLSCLFPCKSPCFPASEKEKSDRSRGSENGCGECSGCGECGSCGAVFTSWWVCEGGGEGRRREIELVVGGGDEAEKMSMRSSRRHVFEDIEIKDDRIEGQILNGEDETGRVSICLPPKNALLLMRCRSDPVKMATLANRFSWDSKAEDEDENQYEEEDDENQYEDVQIQEQEQEQEDDIKISLSLEKEILDLVMQITEQTEKDPSLLEDEDKDEEEDEVESNMSSFEALLDQENTVKQIQQEIEDSPISPSSSPSTQSESQSETPTSEEEAKPIEDEDQKLSLPEISAEKENQETTKEEEDDDENPGLPQCLVLMMCEPKLSMEVSKETWVCKRDFIRWIPERPPRKPVTGNCCSDHDPAAAQPVKKRVSIDSKRRFAVPSVAEKNGEIILQPRRSSCSLPSTAAAAVGNVVEQKLASNEPHELTRCKSEPVKTAAAKLMPESCYWKKSVGKLEPHRIATVGAAGVEF